MKRDAGRRARRQQAAPWTELSSCVIARLYLKPANPTTSQTGPATYFGNNLSSLREHQGDGNNAKEAEKTAWKVEKVVTKKVCDHRLSRRLE